MNTTFLPAAVVALSALAWADGTEQLGAPNGLAVQPGNDVIVAGTGTLVAGAGTLAVDVPAGVAIKQVLAYWEGFDSTQQGHGDADTIFFDQVPVQGQRIGGPTRFFYDYWTSSYRADITDLGLVAAGGVTQIEVDGLDFGYDDDGVGILVIVEDPSRDGELAIADGNDTSFRFFGAPKKECAPVVFKVLPSDVERDACINLFVGSVADNRPTTIFVGFDGQPAFTIVDALGSTDGPLWDSLSYELLLPAGVSSVSVEARSLDSGTGPHAGAVPASIVWVAATFSWSSVTPQQGCSATVWANNPGMWDGQDKDDVTAGALTGQLFNAYFGVTRLESGLGDDKTLYDAVWHRGKGILELNRNAVSALASAGAGINFPFTQQQVVELYREAVGLGNGGVDVTGANQALRAALNLTCPFVDPPQDGQQ